MKFKRIARLLMFLFFGCSSLALALAATSKTLAASIDMNIGIGIRGVLARLSSVFGPSIFEILVILSPLVVFLILRKIFRAKNAKAAAQRFISFIAIFSLLASLSVFTVLIPLKNEDKISVLIGDPPIPEENELYLAAQRLICEIEKNDPPDLPENLIGKTANALKAFLKRTAGREVYLPKPKKIIFSKLFSYTGATALYSFPTGEINLNTKLPSYMIPFTLAHEYAHFLGAGSELDANFFAFIFCIGAEDVYIKYSGYLSALEYILTDIRKINPKMYTDIYKAVPENAKIDISKYISFSKKYHRGQASSFFARTNASYLEAFDSHGAESYSDVTRYITAYLNNPYLTLRIKCSKTFAFGSEKWEDLSYKAEDRFRVKYP